MDKNIDSEEDVNYFFREDVASETDIDRMMRDSFQMKDGVGNLFARKLGLNNPEKWYTPLDYAMKSFRSIGGRETDLVVIMFNNETNEKVLLHIENKIFYNFHQGQAEDYRKRTVNHGSKIGIIKDNCYACLIAPSVYIEEKAKTKLQFFDLILSYEEISNYLENSINYSGKNGSLFSEILIHKLIKTVKYSENKIFPMPRKLKPFDRESKTNIQKLKPKERVFTPEEIVERDSIMKTIPMKGAWWRPKMDSIETRALKSLVEDGSLIRADFSSHPRSKIYYRGPNAKVYSEAEPLEAADAITDLKNTLSLALYHANREYLSKYEINSLKIQGLLDSSKKAKTWRRIKKQQWEKFASEYDLSIPKNDSRLYWVNSRKDIEGNISHYEHAEKIIETIEKIKNKPVIKNLKIAA